MPRARLKKKRRDDTVPATLRKWRAEHGKVLGIEYTQCHVAAACAVALRTVQSWEQGHRKPGAVDLEKLAHAYGVPLAHVRQLLGGANRG
jgi:transcriptional regulator with XRE-family HTH domain